MIVLHYTGMPIVEEALLRLRDPKARVSCHYCVLENGSIVQLVPEAKRAWHAGVSSWQGQTDTNSRSIGIEIANPGHDYGYPDFPKRQIAAVIALCRGVLSRHVILPENIVAHSDVAPSRKQDPGEKFPWRQLAMSGVGIWVEPLPPSDTIVLRPGDAGPTVSALQKSFKDYGYGVEENGQYDQVTADVVTAFQRHFRPARVDGTADSSTVETLKKLSAARAAKTVRQVSRTPVRPLHGAPAAAGKSTATS